MITLTMGNEAPIEIKEFIQDLQGLGVVDCASYTKAKKRFDEIKNEVPTEEAMDGVIRIRCTGETNGNPE